MVVSIKINSVTVDDYIISSSTIPIYKRNKLYEPILFGFDMVLANGITPVVGNDVDITIDGTNRFNGFIDKVRYDYDEKEYEVEVLENLVKLEEYKIDYDTLHTVLAASSGYYNTDDQGYPHLRLDSLLKVMFTKAGLTLDTTDLTSDSSFYTYSGVTWDWEDFILDENMLYCINQDYTMNHCLIDATDDLEANQLANRKIDFLEFFQRICIGFQLVITSTSVKNTYKAYKSGSTASSTFDQYTISDDYKYKYRLDTDRLAANTGVYLELKAHADVDGFRNLYSKRSCTATSSENRINATDHGLAEGTLVRFEGNDLPSGLSENTTYRVKSYDSDTENAFMVELDDTIITLGDNGSGNMYFYGQCNPKIVDNQGYGTYNVPLWNHFRIFLSSGSDNVYPSYPLTTGLMYGGYQYYRGLPSTERILTDQIDFSKVDILELNLDLENRLYELIQAT